MTIQSFTYLFSIAAVWVLYRLLPARAGRQALLLLASYVFYFSWGASFLALLIASSLVNFGLGNYLRKKPDAPRLWLGISFNLLLLVFFKYLPGLHPSTGSLLHRLVMPVGISFWTFQAMSYLFDIYREEELDPTLLEFCLYLAFWPTVLSGPVCRLPDMLPQFRASRNPAWDDISEGTRRIIIGLFMKVVLSQLLAAGFQSGEGVNAGFDQASGLGGLDVWALAFSYGFQLFFDFAGYSNIVIGTARLFGLELQENFRDPYLSTSPSEFWTRWHMSLSFWIRDYVFLPMATLWSNKNWRYFVLFLSMVIFGLWHGATWLYVLWGAYHGALLVGHRLGQRLTQNASFTLNERLSSFLSWAVTFPVMCLGWILFRANTLQQAREMFHALLIPGSYRHLALRPNFFLVTALVIAGYFLVCGFRWLCERYAEVRAWRTAMWALSPVVYSLLIVAVLIWSKQKSVFVYLQF